MAFPSRNPFNKYTCTQCGLSTILVEKGDVRLGAGKCKKCGGNDFAHTKANPMESALAHPMEFAMHIGKKI